MSVCKCNMSFYNCCEAVIHFLLVWREEEEENPTWILSLACLRETESSKMFDALVVYLNGLLEWMIASAANLGGAPCPPNSSVLICC